MDPVVNGRQKVVLELWKLAENNNLNTAFDQTSHNSPAKSELLGEGMQRKARNSQAHWDLHAKILRFIREIFSQAFVSCHQCCCYLLTTNIDISSSVNSPVEETECRKPSMLWSKSALCHTREGSGESYPKCLDKTGWRLIKNKLEKTNKHSNTRKIIKKKKTHSTKKTECKKIWSMFYSKNKMRENKQTCHTASQSLKWSKRSDMVKGVYCEYEGCEMRYHRRRRCQCTWRGWWWWGRN